MPRKRKHMRRNRRLYSEPAGNTVPMLTFQREWLLQSLLWVGVAAFSQWKVNPDRLSRIVAGEFDAWRIAVLTAIVLALCIGAGALSTWLHRRRTGR